ncbi:MAG: hypothetical protein ACLFWM_13565 [Actinomycetota bacterium]
MTDLALVEDPEVCEVCDRDGDLAAYLGDITAHPGCVPEYVRKGADKRDEFMQRVNEWKERKR